MKTNYKYKISYSTFTGGWKEQKFIDHKEMHDFLGKFIMIMDSAVVYQKIKGKYEKTHSFTGHMFYPGGLK